MEKHARSRMSLSRSVEDVTRTLLCEWQELWRHHKQKGRGAQRHASPAPLVVSSVREGQRKRGSVQESATVSMDYKSFGEASMEDDKVTVIVVKDETTGCVAAHVCEQKSAADKWVVERVCDDIDLFGHSGLVLKGDGEPALVQVQSAIKEKRTHPTICQNPPAFNPQSNGSAERAVQDVMPQVRAMKIAVDQRLGTTVEDRLEGTGMDGRVVGGADQSVFGGS